MPARRLPPLWAPLDALNFDAVVREPGFLPLKVRHRALDTPPVLWRVMGLMQMRHLVPTTYSAMRAGNRVVFQWK